MRIFRSQKITLDLVIKPMLFVCLSMTSAASSYAQQLNVITFGDSLLAGLKRDVPGPIICPDGVSLEPGRFDEADDRDVCYGNGAANVGGFQDDMAAISLSLGVTPNILNYGFSGITTSLMLAERSSVLSSLPSASHVIIMAGANDAIDDISPSTVISNLDIVVRDVTRRGMIPILTTVTDHPVSNFGSITSDYAVAIRQYAASNNFTLIDARAELVPWDNFHSGDLLHLGDAGDAVLAPLYLNAVGVNTDPELQTEGSFIPAIISLLLGD